MSDITIYLCPQLFLDREPELYRVSHNIGPTWFYCCILNTPDVRSYEREDCVPPGGDVGEVAHDGGEPVPGVHVEHLPRLHRAAPRPHQHLVVVVGVLPRQPVVGHLVQLRVLAGGRVQVEEVVDPGTSIIYLIENLEQ